MQVSQIMRKAIIIDDNILIKEAARIMAKKNIGSLIIVKDNKIKGIITERDIMKNLTRLNIPVKKVMSKRVVTIIPTAGVEEASDLMINNNVKRLPIVENKNLIGIVTMTDVLAHHEGSFEDEFLLN